LLSREEKGRQSAEAMADADGVKRARRDKETAETPKDKGKIRGENIQSRVTASRPTVALINNRSVNAGGERKKA